MKTSVFGLYIRSSYFSRIPPSILVETAFISNPEEERKLNDEQYQDKLVSSILSGIKKYFASNPALAKTKLALE